MRTLVSVLFVFWCKIEARNFFHQDDHSLELLITLFRHGNRTPEITELYPKDPYLNETYYPFGLGQLTNAGKRREYYIGKVLRDRYNGFLGDYYTPQLVDAWTTDYNRTKMSLELVLASLFPPRGVEIWSALPWQPVPYNYLPQLRDKVLIGVFCPNYLKLYDEEIKSPKWQAEFSKYQKEFNYITQNSGLNVTSFQTVYNLFFGLSTEEEWGFKLPEWTKEVWPKTITDLAIKEYFVATGTTDLARLASGYFLQKILADINAKIERKTPERKIYLYSAHESNIANLLLTLDIFDPPHVPTYGSYVTFEVHRMQDGKYGITIKYENYTTTKLQTLKLKGCEEMCEVNKFRSLVQEYIPSDDLCGI